jgi:hypothetical protein
MTTLMALRCLAWLCARLSLTACGLWRPKAPAPVIRTEVVEVPVYVYKPLPRELTAPLLAPPPPSRNWADAMGTPAVGALDGLATIPAWGKVLGICNRDRANAAQYGASDGQP